MKLAIYAHFNGVDKVVSFAWPYLRELKDLGFRIIFVSNSPLCVQDVENLKASQIEVILRDNIGLDFSMWKAGIQSVYLEEVSELILTNSSVVGPLRSLSWVFDKAAEWDCDFWGLTDNIEIAHHLQSYFVVFRKQVIESKQFRAFWNCVLPYRSKNQIIMSYEVGLTIWLAEQGFSWRPMFEQALIYKSFAADNRFFNKFNRRFSGRSKSMGNVTLLFPELLLKLGFPFLKASLLSQGSNTLTQDDARRILNKYSTEKTLTRCIVGIPSAIDP